MPLILTPATKAQIPALVKTFMTAFEQWPMSRAMRPQGTTPAILEFYTNRFDKEFVNQRNAYMFVVIDTDLPADDNIVCAAKWRLEDPIGHEEARVAKEKQQGPDPEPPDTVLALAIPFHEVLGSARAEVMGDKAYWHLQILATNPRYQKRGAAKLALEWGLVQADRDGLEAYLNSTPLARPMYEKYGFVLKKDDPFPLQEYGVDATNHNYAMVRPARQREL